MQSDRDRLFGTASASNGSGTDGGRSRLLSRTSAVPSHSSSYPPRPLSAKPSSTSASGSGGGGSGGGRDDTTARLMESHNDGQLDVLAGKVTSLRQVTIDIHDNVNRQNQDLDEVDDRFGTLGTSLTSARRRFAQVFFPGDNAQGFDSISTCRLVLYIVGGFFSIVLLVKLIGFVAHLRTPVPVTPPPSTPN